MKHSPFWFPVCPLIIIPVVTVTLVLMFQTSRGQSLAANFPKYQSNEPNTITAKLDGSAIINSSYTTFLSYSLAGNIKDAAIRVTDFRRNLVQEFTVEPEANGSVIIPANLLHEGTYHLAMIVDGKPQAMHDLKVVQ